MWQYKCHSNITRRTTIFHIKGLWTLQVNPTYKVWDGHQKISNCSNFFAFWASSSVSTFLETARDSASIGIGGSTIRRFWGFLDRPNIRPYRWDWPVLEDLSKWICSITNDVIHRDRPVRAKEKACMVRVKNLPRGSLHRSIFLFSSGSIAPPSDHLGAKLAAE